MTHRSSSLFFAALLLGSSSVAFADAGTAYVWANKPTAPNYTAETSYTYNPASGAVRIERKGAGIYQVTLGGLGPQANGGNVQVSAYGTGPEFCKVEGWVPAGSDLQVKVRCFRASAPADSMFTLMFTPSAPTPGTSKTRFAWAGRATTPNYEAQAGYAQNEGQSVQIKRVNQGQFEVLFQGVTKEESNGGNVQVTGYGPSATFCNVARWVAAANGMSALVYCFDTAGKPADAPFSILFLPKS